MWIFGVHDGTHYVELSAESIIVLERRFLLFKGSARANARRLRDKMEITIRYYHTSSPNQIYSEY